MIKAPPINENNLLRWYNNTTPTLSTSQYVEGVHNGYLYKWRNHSDPLPILVNDTLTFYTNFDSDIVGANTIKVAIDGVVINDVTKYVVSSSVWGSNNNKITLTIPATNTANNKVINLVIVDGIDTILYKSNCLIVKQYTEKNINNTHLLKFYHNNNIYDYEWGIYDVMVDTPYTVRVPSSIKDVSYPVEKTIYKSATSGRSRVTRAVNEKKYNFEIYYGQEATHDSIAIIASLKYFEINNKQYIVDGEYSVEFEQNLNIYKGVLSLIDVAFGARINTCTTLS